MCSQSDLIAIIKELAQAYRTTYGNAIDRIILYGSYARGSQDEESDIDLAAIVHGDRNELQKRLRKVWDISDELELKYGIIISPTVVPYDEFMEYKKILPYYRNIEKEGVPIIA